MEAPRNRDGSAQPRNAAPTQFRLVMRAGPDAGKSYPLNGEVITIGRDPTNQICIDQEEVSRRHARIVQKDASCLLEDLGSKNGTMVNQKPVHMPILLNAGDLITMGDKIKLKVEADNDPSPTVTTRKTPRPSYREEGEVPVYSGQVPAGPEERGINIRSMTLLAWIAMGMIVCIWGCLMILVIVTAMHSSWCSLAFVRALWPGACP